MNHPSIHLIDTHCHLNHDQLIVDVDAVVERAQEAGVREMIVVGYDIESSEKAVDIASRYASVFAAIAVHPHDSRHYDDAAEKRLRQLADNHRVVAIGEIGLDYHYNFSPREDQFRAFRAQLALAAGMDLPVIIHCREAYADVLAMLEAEKDPGIGCVMHCWAGTVEEAERAITQGCYLGFGGVLTFKNGEENRAAAAITPESLLLLETDAPYLAPVPFRGKRNEPAHTRLVAEKMAELRSCSLEHIAELTTANARRLFARMAVSSPRP
jgi:TatD DNase family protein